MYSPGEPSCEAREETLTMAPPLPPRRVDIRRTASREHMKAAGDVGGKHAGQARGIDAFEPRLPFQDAGIVDQRVTRPSSRSTVSNSRMTPASEATSAPMAMRAASAGSSMSRTTRRRPRGCAGSSRKRHSRARGQYRGGGTDAPARRR